PAHPLGRASRVPRRRISTTRASWPPAQRSRFWRTKPPRWWLLPKRATCNHGGFPMKAADLKRIPRQRFMPAQINAVGELEVEAVISTAAVARDGHIFVPQGAKLDNYRKNPVVLWQHDTMQPAVGRC